MFVALSSVLYLVLAAVGILAFGWSLDDSLDHQLRLLASELGHAIELDKGNRPHFRDWLRVVQTEPARSLAAIQLYDQNGELLEHFGPPGPTGLIMGTKEAQHFRLIASPLKKNAQVVGYFQLALPTNYRDDARQKLEITIALLAPILLLGLGLTSYVVSDAATSPIRENLQLLKQFIADASHELNTPISILQARAEVLEKKLKKTNTETQDIEIIGYAIERMEKIVNDLMLLAEVEGTPANPAQSIVRLDEVLRNIVLEFQAKFDEKGITLTSNQWEAVMVRASEESIHRIISNLVENAWRYTEPGGVVTVNLSLEISSAKIEIHDSGIGIPAESLPYIFDRFYRVDKSRSRASGGSGLGLSIVKALVDSHKGSCKVDSKLGEGSTFVVFLPVERHLL